MSRIERPTIDTGEQYTIRITDLPKRDRPRERLMQVGEQALSTVELLAITFGEGTKGENALKLAERMLVRFGGIEGIAKASIEELTSVRGIGPDKAARILASMELWQRLSTAFEESQQRIWSPSDAAKLLLPEMSELEEEHLKVLLLSTRNDVLGIKTVLTAGWIEPERVVRTVFQPAIQLSAAAIILAHNHVHGEGLEPSADDVTITRQIVEAGDLFDIEVLDHLIIHKRRFTSLKERGVGFE